MALIGPFSQKLGNFLRKTSGRTGQYVLILLKYDRSDRSEREEREQKSFLPFQKKKFFPKFFLSLPSNFGPLQFRFSISADDFGKFFRPRPIFFERSCLIIFFSFAFLPFCHFQTRFISVLYTESLN